LAFFLCLGIKRSTDRGSFPLRAFCNDPRLYSWVSTIQIGAIFLSDPFFHGRIPFRLSLRDGGISLSLFRALFGIFPSGPKNIVSALPNSGKTFFYPKDFPAGRISENDPKLVYPFSPLLCHAGLIEIVQTSIFPLSYGLTHRGQDVVELIRRLRHGESRFPLLHKSFSRYFLDSHSFRVKQLLRLL